MLHVLVACRSPFLHAYLALHYNELYRFENTIFFLVSRLLLAFFSGRVKYGESPNLFNVLLLMASLKGVLAFTEKHTVSELSGSINLRRKHSYFNSVQAAQFIHFAQGERFLNIY